MRRVRLCNRWKAVDGVDRLIASRLLDTSKPLRELDVWSRDFHRDVAATAVDAGQDPLGRLGQEIDDGPIKIDRLQV